MNFAIFAYEPGYNLLGLAAWGVLVFPFLRWSATIAGEPTLRRAANWLIPATLTLSVTDMLAMSRGSDRITAIATTAGVAVTVGISVAAIAALITSRGRFFRGRRILAAGFLVAATIGAVPAWRHAALALPVSDQLNPRFTAAHAGCYEVVDIDWFPPSHPGHAVGTMVPRFIRLDTVIGENRSSHPAALERGKPLIRPGWLYGGAFWLPLDSNRIVLRWWAGSHGVQMGLRRQREGYRGQASSSSDVLSWSPSPMSSVRLVPADCRIVGEDTARQIVPFKIR